MGRALDEFVVLGCTTNVRFLRELCTNQDVVDGWTTTDMIDRLWPDGWNPNISEQISNAGLLIASRLRFQQLTGGSLDGIYKSRTGSSPPPGQVQLRSSLLRFQQLTGGSHGHDGIQNL